MRFQQSMALLGLLLSFCVPACAQGIRPGDTPPPRQGFELIMQSGFVFASPLYEAAAGIENPAGSGVAMEHVLTITLSDLQRVAGVSGYDEEAYTRIAAQPGFDPQSHALTLYEGDRLVPGDKTQTLTLMPLPDGTALPEGSYPAVMEVTLYDALTGERRNEDFRVDVYVQVMACKRAARAGAEGPIDLRVHNSADAPARYALVAGVDQLGGAHGVDTAQLGEEHSYAVLAMTDVLAPYADAVSPMTLAALPDGQALAPGSYEAWLVRVPEDDDKPLYATARVELAVEAGVQIGETLPVPRGDMHAVAQAVVDCEYLLSLLRPADR